MNGEQIIPPITDPSGKVGNNRIDVTLSWIKTHALMSEQTF